MTGYPGCQAANGNKTTSVRQRAWADPHRLRSTRDRLYDTRGISMRSLTSFAALVSSARHRHAGVGQDQLPKRKLNPTPAKVTQRAIQSANANKTGHISNYDESKVKPYTLPNC